MPEVSTSLYLGDKLVNPIYNQRFVGINSYFQPEPLSPVLTQSALFLDATNPSSYPGSGNTWSDLSGNGNNADVSSITTYWNAGGWFDWPGNDYTKIALVSAANSLDVLDGDFTWLFVATIDATAGGLADLTGLFGMNIFFSNPGAGVLFIRNTADGNFKKMSFYMNNSSSLSTSVAFANIGDWFVIHVVRSGSTLTYYDVNNNSIGSFTRTDNANNNNNIEIGRGRNDASFGYRWDGKVSGFGLYDKALTSDERLQNINYFKDKLGF